MREHDHRKPEAAKTAGDLFLGGAATPTVPGTHEARNPELYTGVGLRCACRLLGGGPAGCRVGVVHVLRRGQSGELLCSPPHTRVCTPASKERRQHTSPERAASHVREAGGVVQICRATGGYTLPRLNSNLYLQGQRFRRISHLDKYTRLRVRLSPSVAVCVCVSV